MKTKALTTILLLIINCQLSIVNCSAQQGAKNYLGTWKNAKAEFELKDDGTTVLGGYPAHYTYEGGMMTFDWGGGVKLTYKVTVTGNTMTSVGNGQNETYQRVIGKSSSSSAGSQKTNTGGMEIAGEWCKQSSSSNNSYFSRSCFKLINDGRYTYGSESSSSGTYGGTAGQSGDAGTWSYDGTTLHITSNTQGQLNYTCTKTYSGRDVALNINGTVYVTSENRGGW